MSGKLNIDINYGNGQAKMEEVFHDKVFSQESSSEFCVEVTSLQGVDQQCVEVCSVVWCGPAVWCRPAVWCGVWCGVDQQCGVVWSSG